MMRLVNWHVLICELFLINASNARNYEMNDEKINQNITTKKIK